MQIQGATSASQSMKLSRSTPTAPLTSYSAPVVTSCDVILGPCCDYAAAPVARQVKPLISDLCGRAGQTTANGPRALFLRPANVLARLSQFIRSQAFSNKD